jgi:hypothetical protein
MALALRRFRVLFISGLIVLSIGAFAGPAAAGGLTVTVPCGCTIVSQQPVGVAPHTPAAENPSGVATFAH